MSEDPYAIYNAPKGKFRAVENETLPNLDHKRTLVGDFDTKEEAIAASEEARKARGHWNTVHDDTGEAVFANGSHSRPTHAFTVTELAGLDIRTEKRKRIYARRKW